MGAGPATPASERIVVELYERDGEEARQALNSQPAHHRAKRLRINLFAVGKGENARLELYYLDVIGLENRKDNIQWNCAFLVAPRIILVGNLQAASFTR